MSATKPNVLLLSIDALRADRMSVYGYRRPTTPNLERMAESAIVCENALTLGPFTQIACIQLFTSSRPLSYGGYDNGAFGRPDTIFKRFNDNGYRTWGMSTVHWVSPYYGYTDGLDQHVAVFHLNTLIGMAVGNMRDTLSLYHSGVIAEDEMLNKVVPNIDRLFDNLMQYSDYLRPAVPRYKIDFPGTKISTDDYDMDKVQAAVIKHRREFERGHLNYIHRHLDHLPESHEWIAHDLRYCRTPSKLIREAAFRVSNALLKRIDPLAANRRANKVRLSVDAHTVADAVCTQLRKHDGEAPFFIWAHIKDTHRPYVSGPGLKWFEHTPRYLKALGYPDDIDPTLSFRTSHAKTDEVRDKLSALYDAAVLSTDEAVGKILATLSDLGLDDNTMVAFVGDHGEEIGDHGDYGHICMEYEHNARVPMIFRPPGAGSATRIESLVSSLDLAPTMAALCGVPAHPDWQGADVLSSSVAERQHIVLETFCRGNCEFEHRPLYMGVRTDTHKYLWRESRDPFHPHVSPDRQLFDLRSDPLEQNDIYRSDDPLVSNFNDLITQRLSEIPEIKPSRWPGRLNEKVAPSMSLTP